MTKLEKGVNNKEQELSEAQLDFLKTCQEIQWGKLEVQVQNGEPVYTRLLEKTFQHKKHKP